MKPTILFIPGWGTFSLRYFRDYIIVFNVYTGLITIHKDILGKWAQKIDNGKEVIKDHPLSIIRWIKYNYLRSESKSLTIRGHRHADEYKLFRSYNFHSKRAYLIIYPNTEAYAFTNDSKALCIWYDYGAVHKKVMRLIIWNYIKVSLINVTIIRKLVLFIARMRYHHG